MTSIWYEVFLITLVGRDVMLLQEGSRPRLSPWMLPHLSNIHPNKLVINYLSSLLGESVHTEKTIVHSTSWRYQGELDRILLTYLAILPQCNWEEQIQSRTTTMTIEPIGEITTQYGDHLFPPEQIERQHVLAHALDHLASLNTYDPTIQAALEAEWQEILQSRVPKPAGGLQRSPILQEALAN
jgi:hypothetical protein